MNLSKIEKRIKSLVILLLMGIGAFAQNDIDNFNIYEIEGKLSIASIFAPQADLSGGIIGTMGINDSGEADLNPIINVVVLDKETNTIIYNIYLDRTSSTFEGNYTEYNAPSLGRGAIYFPYNWKSNDIKSSAFGIDRFHQSEHNENLFLHGEIDIIIRMTVNNAEVIEVKIPGVTSLSDQILLSFWDTYNKRDCYSIKEINKCPCSIWNKMRSPKSSSSSPDLIIAAHRGIWGGELGDGAPENSKRAITAVADQGLNLVELDVMMSKEKELVISHDYILKRLSNYSGTKSYVFDEHYYFHNFNILWHWYWGTPDIAHSRLKKRNGTVSNNEEDLYLNFWKALDILKEKNLVALIDIKELVINHDGSVNPAYNPKTQAGQDKIKESWIEILWECYKVASDRGMLDYIAFKTPYTYEEIAKQINRKTLTYMRFMPMIQRPNSELSWDLARAIMLINSWTTQLPDNLVAIETNFNLPTDSYLRAMTIHGVQYDNLLHYVSSKGLRPGIFSEDPSGVRGVADRWGKWHLPDPNTKNIRGNHLALMNIPYFQTAVITSDRPDVWKQIQARSSSIAQLKSSSSEETTFSSMNDVKSTDNIQIKYQNGSIIISGLNSRDIGSEIKLYDLSGRIIFINKVQKEPQIVLSPNLQNGIYILQIVGNRQMSIKLIIN